MLMKKRFLSMLVLLMTVVTGAWAQSTTHVVKQDNVNTIFSGDGYTLGDAVKDGDVLDFQGTIDIDHSLIINKPVNITSSTEDAVVKLNSASNTETPVNGDPGRAFVINKAGSGTTVNGIRIENTQTWLYNTSNVTFTGVTMWVEEASIGSGVGHVSIRYSDHVTFDGCTVYSKNNGGNSGCVLTGSHDCTFKDTRFEAVGTAGNALYLGYAYKTEDMPAGYTMNNDNISVLNCTLTKSGASSVGMFAIGGLRHHIEGCTMVKMSTSSPFGATVPNSASEGHTILNNTITDGNLYVLEYCTAEGNTVTGTGSVTIKQGATANNNTITVTGTGSVTLNQEATATNNTITITGTGAVRVNKGSTVTGNNITGNVTINSNPSDYIGSTITGNTINGTVTFAKNSKNNTLTRNVITSTGDYAVVMASTADANNTVQYNTLKSAMYNGDEAVNPSTGTGNTISNNSNITLTLAEGTEDADKWTVKVGEEAAAFPVEGLKGGETVTVTYTGTKKVLGMKVGKYNPDPKAVPLTFEVLTNGTIKVSFPRNGMKYSLNGGEKTAVPGGSESDISVKAGDIIEFYGNGSSYYNMGSDHTSIGGTAEVKVYGNIMSLLSETNFATATTLTAEQTFRELFRSYSKLTDASGLLLPAMTLTNNCYYEMFYSCSGMTAAPAELPAETLASSCYYEMFSSCSKLTTAPVLPATSLVSNCYRSMFSYCSKLSSVTCLATSGIDSNNSTTNWMQSAGWQAAGDKTFTADKTASWSEGSNNGIPSGWTRVDYVAPGN